MGAISSFSVIPTTIIVYKLFTFSDTTPINNNFEVMGYTSTSFL